MGYKFKKQYMTFKKLNWIQEGEIQITSGFHGSWQNGQAQDFTAKPLFAPEKCKIRRKVINKNPYDSLVELEVLDTVGTVFYQIVHLEIDKPAGYIFQKGEAITGKDTSGNKHFHIALNINNVWHPVLRFTTQDRNIKIVNNRWTGVGGWRHFDFEKWSFYDNKGDKAIQFTSPTPTPPQKIYTVKPADTQKIYTVKAGDNLTNIVKKHYGITNGGQAHRKMLEVAKYNNLANPNLIQPDQVIKLPR